MSDPRDEPTRIDPPDGDPTRAFPVAPAEAGVPPDAVFPPGPVVPPPPGPDRRVWIIVALVAVVVALLLLLLASDDDDDDDGATGATTSSLSTTTSSPATSAAPTTAAPAGTAAPGPSVAPPVTVDPDDCRAAGANPATPGLAAETVFDAWTRGDEACADTLMTDAAQAELFSRDGTGATDQFQGCTEVDEPDPHADCTFTYEGGSTHYLMNFSALDGWQVFDVEQFAD